MKVNDSKAITVLNEREIGFAIFSFPILVIAKTDVDIYIRIVLCNDGFRCFIAWLPVVWRIEGLNELSVIWRGPEFVSEIDRAGVVGDGATDGDKKADCDYCK